jgi:type II secretory pathway pseudopilin PulG
LCLEPWRFVVLVVVSAAVSVVLSLLLARRDRARRENAELSDKELERRTKENERSGIGGCSGIARRATRASNRS